MEFKIYHRIKNIPPNELNFISNDKFPISYDFLSLIEKYHYSSITPFYILVKQNNKLKYFFYSQVFELNQSHKAFTNFINSTENSKFLNIFKSNLKKISIKSCFFGNLLFTNFDSFKYEKNEKFNDSHFIKILNYIKVNYKIKLIFIPDYYSKIINVKSKYYSTFSISPNMYIDIGYKIKDFNNYLDLIKAKYKKNWLYIKNNSLINSRFLNKDEVMSYSKDISNLYNNVYKKNSYSIKVEIKFILELYFKNKIHIRGYFYKNQLVGFSSFFIFSNSLYVYYIGIDYDLNKNYNIYTKILLDNIEFGIKNNVKKIELGRTAEEFKSNFGAIPNSNVGHIYVKNKIIIFSLKLLSSLLKPKKWIKRDPFKIKK
tara:strand:+ start:2878 stop:3993 length:1116 start_codon:yes stop_codon:yes gene_type:complete